MKIWFEATVRYARENDQGLLKNVSEKYLVDAASHMEAEERIYDLLGVTILVDFQVKRLVPSNIEDVFLYEDADVWHKCKVSYMSVDVNSGREKRVNTFILLTASDIRQAYDRVNESLGNMLVSFEIVSISESPILEVFPYEEEKEGEWIIKEIKYGGEADDD